MFVCAVFSNLNCRLHGTCLWFDFLFPFLPLRLDLQPPPRPLIPLRTFAAYTWPARKPARDGFEFEAFTRLSRQRLLYFVGASRCCSFYLFILQVFLNSCFFWHCFSFNSYCFLWLLIIVDALLQRRHLLASLWPV